MSATGLGFDPTPLPGLLYPSCRSHPTGRSGVFSTVATLQPEARPSRPVQGPPGILTTVLAAKANIVPACLRTLGPLRPSRWVKSAPLLGCWGQWVRGSGYRFKVAESLPLASRGGPAATGPGGLPVGQDSRGGAFSQFPAASPEPGLGPRLGVATEGGRAGLVETDL